MSKLIIELGGYSIKAACQENYQLQKIALGTYNAPYYSFPRCGRLNNGQFVFGEDVLMLNCEERFFWLEIEKQPYYKDVVRSLLNYIQEKTKQDIDSVCFIIPARWSKNEPRKKDLQQVTQAKGWSVSFTTVPISVCYKKATFADGEYTLFYDAGYNGCTISLIQRKDGTINLIDSICSKSLCGETIDTLIMLKMGDVMLVETEDPYLQMLYANHLEKSVEYIKQQLTYQQQCTIPINLGNEQFTITQQEYENMLAKPLANSFQDCLRILQENNIEPASIKQIFLYGGTCHIPFLQLQLTSYAQAQINNAINVTPLMAASGIDYSAIEGVLHCCNDIF